MAAYDYSQNDPAWRDVKLGLSNDWYLGIHNGDTAHAAGCAVTAFAIAASYMGHVVNPAQMNDLMKKAGLIDNNGEFTRDDVLSRLFDDIEYLGNISWGDGGADLNYFNHLSEQDLWQIVLIDCRPEPGVQQHWLPVRGLASNKDILVIDPWDGQRKGLSVYAARDGTTVPKIIKHGITFRKRQPPAAPAQPAPAPTPKPAAAPAPTTTPSVPAVQAPTPAAPQAPPPKPTAAEPVPTIAEQAASKPTTPTTSTPTTTTEDTAIAAVIQNTEQIFEQELRKTFNIQKAGWQWAILRFLAQVFFPGVFKK